MKKENKKVKLYEILKHGMPYVNRCFIYGEDGNILIGLNGGYIPDKNTIKKCIKSLNLLLDIDKRDIDIYNKELDEYTSDIDILIENKKIPGYIYLLESNGKYKIGRSRDIKSRILSYKTQNPFGIRIITTKYVNDYIFSEKHILSLFPKKRIFGEWFSLSKDEVGSITNIIQSL